MYFKYNEDLEITMCFAERKDECSTCANFDICPLVCCVENHLMIPHYEHIDVACCPLKGEINLES